MYFLNNDVLKIIIDQLDVVSLVMLNATCKKMNENIGFQWKLAQHPIQYLNKIDNTSAIYDCLNAMIDDIVKEVTTTTTMTTLYKEYTTTIYITNS